MGSETPPPPTDGGTCVLADKPAPSTSTRDVPKARPQARQNEVHIPHEAPLIANGFNFAIWLGDFTRKYPDNG